MKILSPTLHSAIDYVVVLFLWLAPTLFGLTGLVAILTYALGGVHLLLTLFTNFPYGVVKVIPLKIHGVIELIVSIVLVLSPLLLNEYATSFIEKYFFAFFGVAVFVTWLISDYTVTESK